MAARRRPVPAAARRGPGQRRAGDAVASTRLAGQQAQWLVVGLVLFAVTAVALRGRRLAALERYRYTLAVAGILLLLGPRLPVVGGQVNGAYLAIKLGPFAFQPAELTKIAIVVFLASYLLDTRTVLVTAGRRVLGVTLPPVKQFAPLLVVWSLAMFLLLATCELGTSLMFYGAFLAVLSIATQRLSFVVPGVIVFALGTWLIGTHIGHVHARIEAWQHPFDARLYAAPGGSHQLAQRIFAQADGGRFATGYDQSLLTLPNGAPILPVAERDFIYAVVTNELGLTGAVGLLAVYLAFTWRSLRIALLARDSCCNLLAAGLSIIFALQVFVIVGGVTRLIPLTGITLPFVADGGSSVIMNLVLLALLLVVSNRAATPTR